MSRTKTQSVVCPIPNATSPTAPIDFELKSSDKEYPYIVGVWALVTNLGGANRFDLGVKDSTNGVVLDMAPSPLLEANAATPVDKRYTPCIIKNDGRTIYARVRPDIATTNANGSVTFNFLFSSIEEVRND
jgi:hypothetical protein